MQSPSDPDKANPTLTQEITLTKEELIVKCKNLLSIAQKAKAARDETQAENNNLRSETNEAKKSLDTLSKKLSIAEEMLGALTDQKLKLAMDIDDMKKERTSMASEVKTLYSVKDKAECELENLKKQFSKLHKEKNELVLELETRKKSEIQLQEDITILNGNNEKIRQLCSEEKQRKDDLVNNFEKLKQQLHCLEEEKRIFLKNCSDQCNSDIVGYDTILSLITNPCLSKTSEDDKISRLIAELDITKTDNDKMVKALEQVSIETKQLIDNSEQLNKEIETLKSDKGKMEYDFNVLINKQRDEIENLQLLNNKLEEENYSLKTNLEVFMSNQIDPQKEKKLIDDVNKLKTEYKNLSTNFDEVIEKNSHLKAINAKLSQFMAKLNFYSMEKLSCLNKQVQESDELEPDFQTIEIELLETFEDLLTSGQIDEDFIRPLIRAFEEHIKIVLAYKLSDKEKLIDSLENSPEDSTSDLLDRCKEFEECLSKAEENNEKLVMELKRLQEQSEDVKSAEVKALEEKCNLLESVVLENSNEIKLKNELENNIIKISRELEEKQKEMSLLYQKNESLTNECETHEAKQREYKNEIDKLNSVKKNSDKKHETAIINHKKENERLEELLKLQNRELEISSKKVIDELNAQLSLAHEIKDKFESAHENLKSEHEQLLSAHNQDQLEKSHIIIQLEGELKSMANSYDLKDQELCGLKTELTLAQELKSEYQQLQTAFEQERHNNSKKITQLDGELESVMNTIDLKDRELNELKTKLSLAQGTKSELESAQESHVSKYQQLQSAYDQERIENSKKIIQLEEEIKSMMNTIDLKDQELNEIKTQLSLAQGIKSDLESAQESHNCKYLQLQTTYEQERLENSNNITQLKEELKSLKNTIDMKDQELETTSIKLKNSESELDKLHLLNNAVNLELSNCKSDLESSYKQLMAVEEQANAVKEELSLKEKNNSTLLLDNENLQKVIDGLTIERDGLKGAKDELNSFEQRCKKLQDDNKELNDQVNSLTSNLGQILKERSEEASVTLNDQNKLKTQLKELKELLNFKTLEIEEMNKIWAGRLNSLKVGLMGLRRNMRDVLCQSTQLRTLFSDGLTSLRADIEGSINHVFQSETTSTKHELLEEMHCMNHALKERGEVISKLQDTITELQTKKKQEADEHEEMVKECQKQFKDVEDLLQSKETQIKELESDLAKARECRDSTTDVDVLSTSTISKNDESIRLKDIEESFEDKYVKLKMIAVKLKKRLSDLGQQMESDKLKFSQEKNEYLDKIQHLSTAAKNAQKVQESFDRVLDELEEVKKQNAFLVTSLKDCEEKEKSMKSQISALESSNQHLPNMKKQIDNLNTLLKEANGALQKCEMEKKAEIIKYEEAMKVSHQLEIKIQELKVSLEQALQQGRNNNMLELEIKNYEKIIADLTSQLNLEKSKTHLLSEEKLSMEGMKNGLVEQINLLEKQIKAEVDRADSIKANLSFIKEENGILTSDIGKLNSQVYDLRKELNSSKNNCEQSTTQISNISADFTKKEIEFQNNIDMLQAHVQSLETNLALTKQELSTAKSEIDHLRQEFEGYRLRAQSMLAKQKGETVSQGEKDAKELVEKLKSELDTFRDKLENSMSMLETANSKLLSVQNAKSRCEKKCEDVTKQLYQKISDYDKLMAEYKAHKSSSETLLHNCKLENEAKQDLLRDDIMSLKEKLNDLRLEMIEKDETKLAKENFVPGIMEEGILQEREDAEGSESLPANSVRRLSNIVPLDVLLNNPIDDESRVPILQDQINKLKNELTTYEVRTRHLSSLLSEAEKDSARNSHLNLILKEEMRRLERSLERQPHIANTEYLKNIVFKFLTLHVGDEKSRLIPVLDTILKLSPDEIQKLQTIAKGDSSTWGSYLPSWTKH